MEKNNLHPLFTIIIPTKNRANYLKGTLLTCVNQDYENIEVIVSDDASSDNTFDIVKQFSDIYPFVRYFQHTTELGMRENFEFALKSVKPGYVIALGGDDGLLPNSISKMYELLKQYDVDLITWQPPLYTYPQEINIEGQLALYRKNKTKIINSKDFLNKQVLKLNYLSDYVCPMLYVKGVASTKIVNNICNLSDDKKFYKCPTPDGYSGIVLAGAVEKFLFYENPLTIYGASKDSQGLNYLSNNNNAKKESEKFFNHVIEVPMHAELASQPYSPLITLMTADYLLTARDLQKWNGIEQIDFRNLIRKSILELSKGIYGEERLGRELKIIKNIAIQHNLIEYFYLQLKTIKRKNAIKPFTGNGISFKLIFLSGSSFKIKDIYTASIIADTIFSIKNIFSLKTVFNLIINSFLFYVKKGSGNNSFPNENTW